MLVITNIDTLEVENDIAEIPHWDHDLSPAPHDEVIKNESVKAEVVKGRRFIRPDGSEIMVAASVQSQKVLGLMYEAWESNTRLINNLHDTAMRLKFDLMVSRGAKDGLERQLITHTSTFWKRLKHLFRTPKS